MSSYRLWIIRGSRAGLGLATVPIREMSRAALPPAAEGRLVVGLAVRAATARLDARARTNALGAMEELAHRRTEDLAPWATPAHRDALSGA